MRQSLRAGYTGFAGMIRECLCAMLASKHALAVAQHERHWLDVDCDRNVDLSGLTGPGSSRRSIASRASTKKRGNHRGKLSGSGVAGGLKMATIRGNCVDGTRAGDSLK